ncbi:MAG: extracellular solute-binding protein [Aeromicrobium sp.]
MTVVTERLRSVSSGTLRGAGVTAVIAVLAFVVLGACSPSAKAVKNSSGATILHWYLGPDRVDAEAIARACTERSDGAFEIRVESLPADADKRHNALVRRLSAKDPTIDLIGLDDSFTAEFAEDQLLAPIPDDLAPIYSNDVFPKALAAATYDGALVAAPWWFDPQLLWYRGTVAERAGLDMTKPVTWDKLIEGASRIGASIEIDDHNGRGIADWVTGLVADAGGSVVDGHGRKSLVGLGGDAGTKAASTVQFYAESASGIGPSSDAAQIFASTRGGFLIAPSSVISDPDLAAVASDMRWAPYPVMNAKGESVAPLAGVALAVPLYAPHSELSFKAVSCLTSNSSMAALMTSAGHSSSRATTYNIPGVKSSYPMADTAKASLKSGSAVPQTPYWQLIRAGLQDTWLPIDSVTSASTPRLSQAAVVAILAGELP